MGELTRYTRPPGAVSSPQKSAAQALDTLLREATTQAIKDTNDACLEAVEHIVGRAREIRDPQVVRYFAPFTENLVHLVESHYLGQLDAHLSYMESVADEIRSRSYS